MTTDSITRQCWILRGPKALQRARDLHDRHGTMLTETGRWWPEATYSDRQRIYCIAGLGSAGMGRPFRAPHHTVSVAGLLGSGRQGWNWQPGEASLAHGGTLCLDEIGEFDPKAIEGLRETWEHEAVLLRGQPNDFTAPATFDLIVSAFDEKVVIPDWIRAIGIVVASTG